MGLKSVKIYTGDVLEVLRTMSDNYVHCVVTSPPYWKLRDYGVKGQLGQEKTLEKYIAKMVKVFRQVRRVLREDGTLWLNLGDSYRNKNLCMMPAKLAIALQEDGWWLRSEIIWHKPNPMPESVLCRPTKSHEMIYLLVKSAQYFYDAEAIKEATVSKPHAMNSKSCPKHGMGGLRNITDPSRIIGLDGKRNIRSVWTMPTRPYKGAHFAVFPVELAKRCILAGTSERGCCAVCGKPWMRIRKQINKSVSIAVGWRPTCECSEGIVKSCIVLDPFGGIGTTAEVASKYKRKAILIELKPEYVELTKKRLKAARRQLIADIYRFYAVNGIDTL